MRGVTSSPEWSAAMQEDLNRAEMSWEEQFKAQQRQLQGPAPGDNSSMQQYRLGADPLVTICEKTQGPDGQQTIHDPAVPL